MLTAASGMAFRQHLEQEKDLKGATCLHTGPSVNVVGLDRLWLLTLGPPHISCNASQ